MPQVSQLPDHGSTPRKTSRTAIAIASEDLPHDSSSVEPVPGGQDSQYLVIKNNNHAETSGLNGNPESQDIHSSGLPSLIRLPPTTNESAPVSPISDVTSEDGILDGVHSGFHSAVKEAISVDELCHKILDDTERSGDPLSSDEKLVESEAIEADLDQEIAQEEVIEDDATRIRNLAQNSQVVTLRRDPSARYRTAVPLPESPRKVYFNESVIVRQTWSAAEYPRGDIESIARVERLQHAGELREAEEREAREMAAWAKRKQKGSVDRMLEMALASRTKDPPTSSPNISLSGAGYVPGVPGMQEFSGFATAVVGMMSRWKWRNSEAPAADSSPTSPTPTTSPPPVPPASEIKTIGSRNRSSSVGSEPRLPGSNAPITVRKSSSGTIKVVEEEENEEEKAPIAVAGKRTVSAPLVGSVGVDDKDKNPTTERPSPPAAAVSFTSQRSSSLGMMWGRQRKSSSSPDSATRKPSKVPGTNAPARLAIVHNPTDEPPIQQPLSPSNVPVRRLRRDSFGSVTPDASRTTSFGFGSMAGIAFGAGAVSTFMG
ncbi:hypothetical protein HDU93_000139 [Gonapodya sp. JEL0774]|nr:hypothetical protein HDU93_000139 [Gonapodya sp. JEL0774]